MRHNAKSRALAILLSVMLVIGVMPMTAFAASPEQPTQPTTLEVNGVDILTASNYTVKCGAGTAVYDPETITLTLNNATITEQKSPNLGCIFARGNGDLTVRLIGSNTIDVNGYNNGIYSVGMNLTIEGTDKNADELTVKSESGAGIRVHYGNLTIDSCTLDVKSSGVYGIELAQNTNNYKLTMVNSNVTAISDGNFAGIYSIGEINITDDSHVKATGACGIQGESSVSVDNAAVEATSTSSMAIYSPVGVSITNNSQVNATSTDSLAIYSPADVSIAGGSRVTAKGHWAGIWGDSSVSVDNATVDATSEADAGIYSPHEISIANGAKVMASGCGPGLNCGYYDYNEDKIIDAGKIDISDSEVIANSEYSNAIYTRGPINISGGTVKVTGAKIDDAPGAIYTDDTLSIINSADVEIFSCGLDIAKLEVVPAEGKSVEYKAGETTDTAEHIGESPYEEAFSFERDYTSENPLNYTYIHIKDHTHAADISKWYGDETTHWNTCACGEKLNIANHTFIWVTDKTATATEKGSRHEECRDCKYKTGAVEEIPATGGSSGGGIYIPPTPQNPTEPTNPTEPGTDTEIDDPNTPLGQLPAEEQIKLIQNAKIVARSVKTTLHGKSAVKVSWTVPEEIEDIKLDGYQIFRSTQRYKGYGKKPFFTTKTKSYINNLNIKKGNTYYYKVRGYKTINGKQYYTSWSTKAWRRF